MKSPPPCELCGRRASLHCPSDSAFLCFDCDARVHEANFIVARHERRTLCPTCNGSTANTVSGVGVPRVQLFCRICEADGGDGVSSAESVAEASRPSERCRGGRALVSSTAGSDSGIRIALRAEVALVPSSRRLGLRGGRSVAIAGRARRRRFRSLPSRVSQAARRLGPTCQLVKTLRCSRAPARLILFVEWRRPLLLSRRCDRKALPQKGWADSSHE